MQTTSVPVAFSRKGACPTLLSMCRRSLSGPKQESACTYVHTCLSVALPALTQGSSVVGSCPTTADCRFGKVCG